MNRIKVSQERSPIVILNTAWAKLQDSSEVARAFRGLLYSIVYADQMDSQGMLDAARSYGFGSEESQLKFRSGF